MLKIKQLLRHPEIWLFPVYLYLIYTEVEAGMPVILWCTVFLGLAEVLNLLSKAKFHGRNRLSFWDERLVTPSVFAVYCVITVALAESWLIGTAATIVLALYALALSVYFKYLRPEVDHEPS